jgi:hypothetical protein
MSLRCRRFVVGQVASMRASVHLEKLRHFPRFWCSLRGLSQPPLRFLPGVESGVGSQTYVVRGWPVSYSRRKSPRNGQPAIILDGMGQYSGEPGRPIGGHASPKSAFRADPAGRIAGWRALSIGWSLPGSAGPVRELRAICLFI